MSIQISVTPNGRMTLPVELRDSLGLAEGGTILVEETPDGVILRSVGQSIARAQAIVRTHGAGAPSLSIDAFLANRKAAGGA